MNELSDTPTDAKDEPDRMINDLAEWRRTYEEADSDWRRGAILEAHHLNYLQMYGDEFDRPGLKERVMRAVKIEQEAIRGETELALAAGCSAMALLARNDDAAWDESAADHAEGPAR